MNVGNSAEDALKEGRFALVKLEKRLHQRGVSPIKSIPQHEMSIKAQSVSKKSLFSERQIMDKVPRNDRLKNRRGSPLGLTLEVFIRC